MAAGVRYVSSRVLERVIAILTTMEAGRALQFVLLLNDQLAKGLHHLLCASLQAGGLYPLFPGGGGGHSQAG